TGNIKVSNDYNTIVANNIIYDENNYVILAYNGINFLSKFEYDKTIECNGKIACYNENKKSVAIFGDVVLKLNYFINNLYLHIVLYADDIYIDYGAKTLRTFIDANNFDVMNYCNKSYYFNDVLLKKFLYDGALKKYNRKKIVASICGDKRKCICEANKITFCYSGDDNKIFIEGSVILTFTE
ncbi:MAG: hypothetical protein LBH27_01585, partial [Endomicrobium sp.]|nr:hypothetical protein [Endomicrobium sp.]